MPTIICEKCNRKISISQWQIESYIEDHGKLCHNCLKKLEKEQEKEDIELLKSEDKAKRSYKIKRGLKSKEMKYERRKRDSDVR